MCGIDSVDGSTPWGLNLCCSYYGWCGTEEVHCKDPEPQYGKTPCQTGYGSREVIPARKCGATSGSSKKRRIGYYKSNPVFSWSRIIYKEKYWTRPAACCWERRVLRLYLLSNHLTPELSPTLSGTRRTWLKPQHQNRA
jgi:hypothetical protein